MEKQYRFPFERYEIWKLSLDLSVETYSITISYPKEEKYGITSQIRRAANSVGANIAEGVSRFSEKEKGRFIEISFGSLMEVAHFLFLSRRLELINKDEFDNMKVRIHELSNKINAFYKKLNF